MKRQRGQKAGHVGVAGADPLRMLREGYAAFDARDYDTVLFFLDPDVVWEQSPGVPESGIFRGREQVRRWFESFDDVFADVHIELVELIPRGDWTIASVRISGRGRQSEIPIDMHFAQAWRFSDGRFVQVKEHVSVGKIESLLGRELG